MSFRDPKPQNGNDPATAPTVQGQTRAGSSKVKQKVRQNSPFVNLEDQVHVGEIVRGESGECRQTATLLGCEWPMTHHVADHEPRIGDLDLARRLGFERPRTIRTIIQRLVRAGHINPKSNRCTVQRFDSAGNSRGSVETTSYSLALTEALLIATQSKTKDAMRITKEMIAVFVAVRRAVALPRLATTEPETKVVIVESSLGLLGERWKQIIDAPLRRLAARLVAKFGGTVGGRLRGLMNKLEKAVGHSASFRFYPVEPLRMSKLMCELRLLDIQVCDRTKGLPDAGQAALFGGWQ